MPDYIRTNIMDFITQDRPLPITQSFIDTVNREVAENPDAAVTDSVAKGAIMAIAQLEMKVGRLMDALGAVETPIDGAGNTRVHLDPS